MGTLSNYLNDKKAKPIIDFLKNGWQPRKLMKQELVGKGRPIGSPNTFSGRIERLLRDGIIESEHRKWSFPGKKPRKTLGFRLSKHALSELNLLNQPSKRIRLETADLYEGEFERLSPFTKPWKVPDMMISGEVEVISNVDIDFEAESRIRSLIASAVAESFRKAFREKLGGKIHLGLHGWFTIEPKPETGPDGIMIQNIFQNSIKYFNEENMIEWAGLAGRLSGLLDRDERLAGVMVSFIQGRINEHPLTMDEIEVDMDDDGIPCLISELPLYGRTVLQSLLDDAFSQFKDGKVTNYEFARQLLALWLFYHRLKEFARSTERGPDQRGWELGEDHWKSAQKKEKYLKKLWGSKKFAAIMKRIEESERSEAK